MSDCPVNRHVYGQPCDGPGTYYCDYEIWGSRCRAHFERLDTPALPARATQHSEETK